MHEPLLFIDTDIFILLSGAGLLDRSITLLGFDNERSRRLPALEHQIKRGSRFKKYPAEIREAALRQAQSISKLSEQPENISAFQRLIVNDQIDYGEAVLFALLAEHGGCVLETGDKRSVTALATAPELHDIRDAVAGRIACLETVLSALLETEGVKRVASALTPLREFNTTLRVVFSGGASTPESMCRDHLESYLRDLENQVGTGFLMTP